MRSSYPLLGHHGCLVGVHVKKNYVGGNFNAPFGTVIGQVIEDDSLFLSFYWQTSAHLL